MIRIEVMSAGYVCVVWITECGLDILLMILLGWNIIINVYYLDFYAHT